ncbi:hypothetical protein [Rubritalea tangerina]|uniref:hypothetical protein n=1 Tax=Rubritalea tangerina TaxID=430798 RepID=UPI00360CBB4B
MSKAITIHLRMREKRWSREVVEGGKLSDAEMREVWLRKVQTKPADFLKVKFMYQDARKGGEGDE